MRVGTKSVLFGVHAFWLHPFFVAAAWTKLYGFPWDPRLWFAFFLHDLGYLGRPNMDGPEGELHPELGARIMGWLFDWEPWGRYWDAAKNFMYVDPLPRFNGQVGYKFFGLKVDPSVHTWHDFTLYHSRYYAKRDGAKPSRLCFADKLVLTIEPAWLYLLRAAASGEIQEYLENAQRADSPNWKPTGYDKRRWYKQLGEYMQKWVDEHKNGSPDTWTSTERNAKSESGVWK